MTTTYELYTNENGTPKAVEGKAPAIIERVEALETDVTGLQASLDEVDLTAIRESISNVSSKVDGIGDTLSPTYAKKQAILDACDQAMNGANPVHAGDPALDDIKSALATIQAQLGQLESRRYVKETGKSSDGTSWYRVWSDGFIEQGGESESEKVTTISLPCAMSSSNYVVNITPKNDTNTWETHVTERTTTTFSVGRPYGGVMWYVCGY